MVETLGMRLKRLREKENLIQSQVATIIGMDKSAVSYYENDSRQPPYATLVCLANLYNVTTDYLLGNKSGLMDVSGLTSDDLELVKILIDGLKKKNNMKAGR